MSTGLDTRADRMAAELAANLRGLPVEERPALKAELIEMARSATHGRRLRALATCAAIDALDEDEDPEKVLLCLFLAGETRSEVTRKPSRRERRQMRRLVRRTARV
jgi:hypothetical protein